MNEADTALGIAMAAGQPMAHVSVKGSVDLSENHVLRFPVPYLNIYIYLCNLLKTAVVLLQHDAATVRGINDAVSLSRVATKQARV